MLKLIKFLLLTLTVFYTEYSYSNYNLNQFRPDNMSINRDSYVRYRGVGPELEQSQAISAMLGHEESSLKSMLFDGVRLKLMGETVPFYTSLRGYFSSYINNEIASETRDGSLKYDDAVRVARKIVTHNFYSKYNSTDIINNFINYRSSAYLDYPNDPREIIFSTVYMEIAANYSPYVVSFRDSQNFGIDLNYYNYIYNSIWIRKIKPWPDKGEYANALEVSASDIEGFQVRKNFVKDFETFNFANGNLDYAIQKITYDSQPYLLVIDGNGHDGVVNDNGDVFYSKSIINPLENIPSLMKNTKQLVNVSAIIARCEINLPCSVPSELFKKYQVKGISKVSDTLLYSLKQSRFDIFIPKLFYKNIVLDTEDSTGLVDENDFSDMEYLTYLKNKDMSNDSLLKVVELIEDVSIEEDTFSFNYEEDKELAPGDSIYFVVPDEFSDREIKSIKFNHRKVDSSENVALSVQVYSMNEKHWKVSNLAGRKGRLNTIYSQLMNTQTHSILTGWDNNSHLSFKDGSASNKELNGKAIRFISMSWAKCYFNNLTVEFEK